MEPRISIITLGVNNLDRSLRFYRDGLGFPTTWSVEKGVIFFKTGGVCLALYPYAELAKDATLDPPASPPRFPGFSLAHNVRSKPEVDELIHQAELAGATVIKAAHDTFWGGYSGYFADPDGYLWEVAYGAFPIREDGSVDVP